MYNYSLQYLCDLDNSIRRHSNITSGSCFLKDHDFWMCYDVPLYFVWAWYMQKLAAASEIKENGTRKVFVSHTIDWFLK